MPKVEDLLKASHYNGTPHKMYVWDHDDAASPIKTTVVGGMTYGNHYWWFALSSVDDFSKAAPSVLTWKYAAEL